MATYSNTSFNGVVDSRVDRDGKEIKDLKIYGELSENAELQWEPTPYRAFGKIMRATNSGLSTAIREYYAKTFHDIRGVYIAYDPARLNFILQLYFSKNALPCPEGKIENLRDLTVNSNGSSNLYYQRQLIDNKASGKHYTLNDQTKILLSDIMFGGRQANKPNNNKVWNNCIKEVIVPMNDSTYAPRAVEVLVLVSGCFDFRRVLSKLFGNQMIAETKYTTKEDGTVRATNVTVEAAYEARFIKNMINDPNTFIINIEQFDKGSVEEISFKENPVRPAYNGVIYY